MDKITYLKLEENDILSIIVDYYREIEKLTNSEYARCKFLGTSGKDLRCIAVFGNGSDNEMKNLDLEEVDKKLDYNGTEAFFRNNPQFTTKKQGTISVKTESSKD